MRIKSIRAGRLLPVLLCLGLALGACQGNGDTGDDDVDSAATGDDDTGGDEAGDEDAGDDAGVETLVIGFDSEPTTLDAQLIRDRGKDIATHRINERLVDFDNSATLVPVLAAELPELVEGDENRWRVPLREGVTFTDGEPWNADALVANIERILDEDFGSVYTSELGAIESAEAVDEHTVEIVTNKPEPLLPIQLRELAIVSPAAAASDDYGENPVGTGPYVFSEWVKGDVITLEANPDWWGGDVPIPTVEIRFIPDAGTRISALQADEIHVAANLTPDEASRAPSRLVSTGPTAAGWIRLDVREEPFSSLEFRQGLNYAIDKEALSDALFDGLFEPAECQVSTPQAVGVNPDLEPWPYDPEMAQQLFEESGFAGATLDLEWTTSVYGGDRELGESVAGMLRQAGFDVNVTFNEIGPFVDKFYAIDETAPEMIYGETDNTTNHTLRQLGVIFRSGGPGTVTADAAGFEEMTNLLEEAATEMDAARREELYMEFQELQCDLAPVVYLLNRVETWGTVEGLEYEPNPAGAFARFYFEDVSLG